MTTLIAEVAGGGIALPEFQRDFLWTPENVVELLESLANGWPIGSLLLLEGPQPFGLKKIDGGPEPDPDAVRLLVLDGQQRVTSIFHALNDGSDDTIYFVDLDPERSAEQPVFEWVRRSHGIPAGRRTTCHPIAALLDPFYRRSVEDDLRSAGIDDVESAVANKLGYLLSDLKLSTIVLNQDIELEALTRIFETLNRTGLRLDAFDLMVAILYAEPERFHLGDEWKAAQAEHRIYDRMDAKGIEILKLIALRQIDVDRSERPSSPRRVVGVRQRDVLNTPRRAVIKNWPLAERHYRKALALVEHFGVRNSDFLPSEAMLITVADAIWKNRAPDQITAWWWSAIALQSYAQGANTQVVADSRHGIGNLPELKVISSNLDAGLLDQSRRNRILRLGIRCRAIAEEMRDPLTGEPLGGKVEELMVGQLLGHESNRSRALVVDGLLVNKSSSRAIKKMAEEKSLAHLVDGVAERQGFPTGWQTMALDEIRAHRSRELSSWFVRQIKATGALQ